MTALSPELDPQALADTLAGTLALQIRRTAAGLGPRLSPGRIAEMSSRLLGASAAPSAGRVARHRREL